MFIHTCRPEPEGCGLEGTALFYSTGLMMGRRRGALLLRSIRISSSRVSPPVRKQVTSCLGGIEVFIKEHGQVHGYFLNKRAQNLIFLSSPQINMNK